MEEKRIKSAFEIAMEKVASMPDLTQKELAEQQEREYQPRGAAIAHKYLEGAFKERDLQPELSRYRGQEGEIVKLAFLQTLNQSVKSGSKSTSLKALDGIKAVEPALDLGEMKRQIEAIFDEFDQQLGQRIQQYEIQERKRLRQFSISGSAVKPNLKESQTWQEELKRTWSEYDPRISTLKEKLMPG